MRRAAKIDANQPDVVKRYRQWGASVAPAHSMGHGFPDLVVGLCGHTVLVEVKDGSLSPSRRKLTPEQELFHRGWLGDLRIVETLDDVDRHCEEIRQRYARTFADAIAPVRPVAP